MKPSIFEVLGKVMQTPARSIDIVVEKMCSFLTQIAKKGTSITFNSALRAMLIEPRCYQNLPAHVIDGLIMILTIPVSEAIAETQGSCIDALHLRYKRTDKDDLRLQNELKVQLMGPEACSEEGEKLVEGVAKRLAKKHSFINTNNKMGPAIFFKEVYT